MPHEGALDNHLLGNAKEPFHGFAQEDVRHKTVQSGGFKVFLTSTADPSDANGS